MQKIIATALLILFGSIAAADTIAIIGTGDVAHPLILSSNGMHSRRHQDTRDDRDRSNPHCRLRTVDSERGSFQAPSR